MSKKRNPSKYLDKVNALHKAAREEIINILSDNPSGRYIEFDTCEDDQSDALEESRFSFINDDDEVLMFCAIGLNDDDELVFKAYDDDSGMDYNDGEWTELEESMDRFLPDIYAFVVNNLKYAKDDSMDDSMDDDD